MSIGAILTLIFVAVVASGVVIYRIFFLQPGMSDEGTDLLTMKDEADAADKEKKAAWDETIKNLKAWENPEVELEGVTDKIRPFIDHVISELIRSNGLSSVVYTRTVSFENVNYELTIPGAERAVMQGDHLVVPVEVKRNSVDGYKLTLRVYPVEYSSKRPWGYYHHEIQIHEGLEPVVDIPWRLTDRRFYWIYNKDNMFNEVVENAYVSRCVLSADMKELRVTFEDYDDDDLVYEVEFFDSYADMMTRKWRALLAYLSGHRGTGDSTLTEWTQLAIQDDEIALDRYDGYLQLVRGIINAHTMMGREMIRCGCDELMFPELHENETGFALVFPEFIRGYESSSGKSLRPTIIVLKEG